MASEQDIAEAEADLRQAEANLQKLLTRSINNGVMLESAGRGLELRRLREEVAAARKRLQDLKDE